MLTDFKILSLPDSAVNVSCNINYRYHHTSNASLPYLVNGKCQETSKHRKLNVLFNYEF